ncbi:MAG TPA: polysaccharide deacetylase family protein [Candidatus Limnocylindrales bacterium]|nr:polysaccharide deacetylase family protein [Candidatus Limnocylindrales bacterium]
MIAHARRVAAVAASGPLGAGASRVVDRVLPRRRGVLSILTYHRVDEPSARPDLMPSLISATPAGFAAQMAMVAREFDPVSLTDVLAALDDPRRLPRRAVLVTFDDGYRDFATNAWPVLRAAAVPGTLFVATAFTGDAAARFWWDRLWAAIHGAPPSTIPTPIGALPVGPSDARATVSRLRDWLKALDHDAVLHEVERIVDALRPDGEHPGQPPAASVLDWDELRGLAAEGVTLAPHTRTHPLLDRVDLERAEAEISGSFDDLQRETGDVAPPVRVLAYPSGAHGDSAVEAARRAGMTLAMTTRRGGNDLRRSDRLRLRRINVGGRASLPLIRAQLAWAATLDVVR